MKNRDFSKFALLDPEVQGLLGEIARPYEEIREERYRTLMREVGMHLAASLLAEGIDKFHNKDICVVCTVEDADFLAAGVMEGLERGGVDASRLYLQCFWNERVRSEAVSLSPILRQYVEPFDTAKVTYVVVKSIISGACVVRTNLTRVLSDAENADVYVAAPVLLDGAQNRLSSEFPADISSRFKYVWFATDYEKDGDHVLPGVGGSVYERLGLGNEISKNTHIPTIVKQRRSQRTWNN